MNTQMSSETRIDEIADGIFRISTPVDSIAGSGITYNQYLIVDDEPLLFHTGKRRDVPAGTGGGRSGHADRATALDLIFAFRGR
jgi:hypothetical protein